MGWGLRRDVSGTRPEAAGARRERRAGGRGPGAAAWGGGEIAPAGAWGGGQAGLGLGPAAVSDPRVPTVRERLASGPHVHPKSGTCRPLGEPAGPSLGLCGPEGGRWGRGDPRKGGDSDARGLSLARGGGGPRAAAPLVRRIRAPTHIHGMSRGLGWSRRTCWAPRPAPRPTPGCSPAPCVSPQQGFDRNMLGALAGANSLRNFTSRF